MIRSSIIRAAIRVTSRCMLSTQHSNNFSLLCHRVLTRFRREETHCLSNDRYLWAGQSHSTTRFYSNSAIDVDVEELDCILNEEHVQLFDVREPSELLETGKIPRSVNIPRMF